MGSLLAGFKHVASIYGAITTITHIHSTTFLTLIPLSFNVFQPRVGLQTWSTDVMLVFFYAYQITWQVAPRPHLYQHQHSRGFTLSLLSRLHKYPSITKKHKQKDMRAQ